MKSQFTGLLHDTGFVPSSDPKDSSANVNSDNMKLVKAVLCAGLYPNVFKVDQTKPGRYMYSLGSIDRFLLGICERSVSWIIIISKSSLLTYSSWMSPAQ